MIIYTKFIADRDYIRQRKQNIIHDNNERENARRIPHTYQIGDRVLLKKYNQHKYSGPEYKGPYMITVLYVSNGISSMTSSTSETSSLAISELYVP